MRGEIKPVVPQKPISKNIENIGTLPIFFIG